MIAVAHHVAQRTPEWHALRCGRLTGTGAGAMIATLKSGKGEAAERRDLRLRLVVEQLTRRSQDAGGFVSNDMQWGIDHEADARRAYEALSGHVVHTDVGFVSHPELRAGCSPDGLVGAVGCVEIKCPKSATHLATIRQARGLDPLRCLPREYVAQVQHLLWLTGARWCDFVSFDPRFPRALQLAVVRVTLSDGERAAWEITVRNFLDEVARELADVEQLLGAPVAA
jgi:hypothetical protein